MTNHVPSSAKAIRFLQIIFFSSAILYFGKTLFIPLFYGLLIAIVLFPVCKWLEQKRFPRTLAITVCLLIVALLLCGIIVLLIWQIGMFRHDAPILIKKLQETLNDVLQGIERTFGITTSDWSQQGVVNIGSMAKTMVNDMLDTVFIFFLVPIYTALFLYHRHVFVQFLRWVAGERHKAKLDLILHKMIHTYFNYIKGMIFVYIIVGILNSIGLLILGIEHAILFGMLCAIMTIIPYAGIFISSLLPISIAWLSTGSVWYPLGVVAVFTIVQYLEANVIFPKVVGVQLNISTWAMLVAIIAGGVLWGVSGMILFIPLVALLKIASDYIEEWKPLNILLRRDK